MDALLLMFGTFYVVLRLRVTYLQVMKKLLHQCIFISDIST